MATLKVATTQHCHTDKSLEILTNRPTYQDYKIKTRKDVGKGTQKALAAMPYKGPCMKAPRCKPPAREHHKPPLTLARV